MIVLSMLFSMLGFWITGPNPQGLQGVTYDLRKYSLNPSMLPFIGFGEEILTFVVFFGLFTLIQGNRLFKLAIAIVMTAFIFGLLHVFNSPFLARIPIALGGIPILFLVIYYRSIVPTIIEYMLWDGINFLGHFEQIGLYMLHLLVYMGVVFIFIFRDMFTKKRKKKEGKPAL